jgi:hypothetical protein
MEISNLLFTKPSNGKAVDASPDVLSRLQQIDSIQARVVSIVNGQALLLTRFGEITGSNALKLKAGDTVQIRLDGDNQNPVLKVTPSQDQVTLLAANKFLKLLALLPENRPIAATVVSQQSNNTLLKLGSNKILIPLQSQLKIGQLLNIVHRQASATIEIKQVDHQQVLKSALSQLISARQQTSTSNQLQPLLQLVQSILRIDIGNPSAATLTNNSQNFSSIGNTNQSHPLPNNTMSTLASGLELLIRSLPTVTALNQRAIQKMIELATQNTLGAKPEKNTSNTSVLSILRQLPQSEQGLNQLIKLLLNANQDQINMEVQQLKKPALNNNELLLTQFRDAIRSTEQSLNQQLFQQTSLRFQQELQQPIAFNLNIPYVEQQMVKSLQLKVLQKNSGASAENDVWEIRLSFDFSLLGLISTHILLDGNTLSTNFWAVEAETKNKVNDALPSFKQQLIKSGFNLGYFFCYLGQPPQENDNAFSPVPDSLLDIKA